MKHLITLLFLFLNFNVFGQKNLAEKLGYSADAKLLIIHADDVGVSHSENRGSITALETGMVNSASIMMPCPWVSEIASYAKENTKADFGLHLTLTSEWETMKWSPVASKSKVKSLINSNGFFYAGCEDFQKNAKIEEVEIELRAQIEQAYKMGIRPTHLDTHMGCLVFNSPELFGVYLKLGREYNVPVLLSRFFLQAAPQAFKDLIQPADIIIEKTITAGPDDFTSGMANYYEDVLTNLSPGVSTLLIHVGFDDAEMQALSIDHPMWGAKWRQDDFDFFTSEKFLAILEK